MHLLVSQMQLFQEHNCNNSMLKPQHLMFQSKRFMLFSVYKRTCSIGCIEFSDKLLTKKLYFVRCLSTYFRYLSMKLPPRLKFIKLCNTTVNLIGTEPSDSKHYNIHKKKTLQKRQFCIKLYSVYTSFQQQAKMRVKFSLNSHLHNHFKANEPLNL